jgi:hypothetical protein
MKKEKKTEVKTEKEKKIVETKKIGGKKIE